MGKTISTDMFFILANITTNFQMDASEFEGMIYTMLYEEPFANHILDMTDGMKKVQYMIICLRNFPSQLEIHGNVLLVKPNHLPIKTHKRSEERRVS